MKLSVFKTSIIFILLAILGFFALPRLSVRLNPSKTLPSITVNYSWPNASPYTLEREITTVLESGFSTLKGIKDLYSMSSKGNGYITLVFDKYTNVNIARFEVATIIRQLYIKLPKQTSYPTISINKSNDDESRAFLSYSINAPESPFDIQTLVKTQIAPIINAVPFVDKTEVYGANPKEYILSYNNDVLTHLKLNKQVLINALTQSFKKLSLGNIKLLDNYITLSIQPSETALNWHIPVKKSKDKIFYLDELVAIKEIEQETQYYYRINGKSAITLAVYSTKNANTISLSKTISEKLVDLKQQLPISYEVIKTYDSTEYLNKELNKIYKRSFYTIIILLFFIILISKSFNYLLIVIISLVTNMGIAFLLYFLFKIEIQLYSLAGITISLGLIIDNSIVMIDHIRHRHNKSIFVSILASTLTTIGALSLIYFLDEEYKVNLIDFALVIIINLSVSLIVALFFIPALLEKINLQSKVEKLWSLNLKKWFYRVYNISIIRLLQFKKIAIISIILIFGLPIFMLPQKLENNDVWYESIYNSTMGNEWYIEHIRPLLDKSLGGTFRLFSNYVFESAYYNENEETKLYVDASMQKGATIDQMNEVFLEIENYLRSYNKIKQYSTNIYSSNYGSIEISFDKNISESSFPSTLKAHLIRKVMNFGGMDWDIYGEGKGYSNNEGAFDHTNFSIECKGYNYDILNSWADTLKIALEQNSRVQKVLIRENSVRKKKVSFEYYFSLDKERLALAKASPLNIVNELKQRVLSKQQDISLNIQGKYAPIRIESKASKTFDLWHVKNNPIESLNSYILLKDILTVTKEQEEENIYKKNQEYKRLVEFQYTGAYKFGSKFLENELKTLENRLPLGYSFERSESQWLFNQKKNDNYIFLLLLVLSIIYTICSILFESFKQPFIILSIIPISFIGVFLTFCLFDFNFDQGGLASFVLLSGITVNASIYIVNNFNKLKKQYPDQNYVTLYLEAFKQKIFPILLTVISTIVGFIPFIIDGQNEVFWFALGVGTIGGLLFSLIGILFYLPIFTLKKIRLK